MKKITSANYKKDKLYGPVARAMAEILKNSATVAPVDVLLRLQKKFIRAQSHASSDAL